MKINKYKTLWDLEGGVRSGNCVNSQELFRVTVKLKLQQMLSNYSLPLCPEEGLISSKQQKWTVLHFPSS